MKKKEKWLKYSWGGEDLLKGGKDWTPQWKKILYLTENRATEKLFEEIQQGLAKSHDF